MQTETIKAIFTNLLFVIGVILIIFGFVQGTLVTVRMITFEKYPLNSYEETRCDLEYNSRILTPTGEVALSDEQIAAQKEMCLKSIEHERQVRKTEHLVTAITTLVAGTVLVLSFRRFIFK